MSLRSPGRREPVHSEPNGRTEVLGARSAVDVALTGRWRIVDMDLFDAADLDLLGPAFIELRRDRTGSFQFLAVEGEMDCRAVKSDGRVGVEFSWEGSDDGHPVSGRGSALLNEDRSLAGHIFIHMGDDTGFVAQRNERDPKRRR